ncbi:MAG TPA: stilbene synthase, partial [Opitutaceae bacterium]
MFLHSLATELPPATFTQQDCWNIVERSGMRARLKRRSILIMQTILKGDHGIATRHFAMPEIERVFDRTSDELNDAFRAEAPALAGRALSSALAKAGLEAASLDALLICTCTGYLCPGITSYVAEKLGIRQDAILHDLVGLGCGA